MAFDRWEIKGLLT